MTATCKAVIAPAAYPPSAPFPLVSDAQCRATDGCLVPIYAGEVLEQRQRAAEQAARQVNEVQKRIERRKAYMEVDAARDDTPLLLGLLTAFVAPAAIILGEWQLQHLPSLVR